MDSGNVGGFKTWGEMRGGNDVIDQFEYNREGGVTQNFDEPFLPTIRPWGGTSISSSKKEPEVMVIKGLRPEKGRGGDTVSNLTNRGGNHPWFILKGTRGTTIQMLIIVYCCNLDLVRSSENLVGFMVRIRGDC